MIKIDRKVEVIYKNIKQYEGNALGMHTDADGDAMFIVEKEDGTVGSEIVSNCKFVKDVTK